MQAVALDRSARSITGVLRFRAAPDAGGTTRVADAMHCAPLQLQRPLYLDQRRSGLATVNIINATAGVFDGDVLSVNVDVMPGAALELRTPTMTRIFGMGATGEATTTLDLNVDAGGYVESLPAALILCADAALRQTTRVALAADAHAAVGEVWVFGRVAHDELHAYRELDARTEVYRAGSLILVEALRMRPADGLAGLAVGGYAAYGSMALIGPLADGSLLARTRELIGAYTGVLGGASLLADGAGLTVRVLGGSAHAVQVALAAIMREFRARSAVTVRGEPCGGER